MAVGVGTIIELRLEADGVSGRITCPPGLRPAPGQYLATSGADTAYPLPVVLFPQRIEDEELVIAAPLPEQWTAGMQISLRGPLGSGFRMPQNAQRVALAGLEGSAARLLPVADLALKHGAAVVVYANSAPADLPPEVEILSLDLLPEAHIWADFLAVEVSLSGLPSLRQRMGLKPYQRPNSLTQVMIWTQLPCTGLAECGICAVAVQNGWRLVCSDGPVFDFNQLEGV
jgi:NAD(P)H-flavin reductase